MRPARPVRVKRGKEDPPWFLVGNEGGPFLPIYIYMYTHIYIYYIYLFIDG